MKDIEEMGLIMYQKHHFFVCILYAWPGPNLFSALELLAVCVLEALFIMGKWTAVRAFAWRHQR